MERGKSRVRSAHIDERIVARIRARAANQVARDEVVGGADGDGDGFTLQIADGFELRARDQRVERSSQGQAHQPHRRAGNRAARNRAGAEGVIDLSRLDRADGERRAHGDDLGVDPVLAVKAALFGRPSIEEAERLRRHRDTDFFQSGLGRNTRAAGTQCKEKQ